MAFPYKGCVPYGISYYLTESVDDGGWYGNASGHPLSGRGDWGHGGDHLETGLCETREDADREIRKMMKPWIDILEPVRIMQLEDT